MGSAPSLFAACLEPVPMGPEPVRPPERFRNLGRRVRQSFREAKMGDSFKERVEGAGGRVGLARSRIRQSFRGKVRRRFEKSKSAVHILEDPRDPSTKGDTKVTKDDPK